MLVVGYKTNANFAEAARVIKKHTNMETKDVQKVVSQIKEGQGVKLPNDFVLREDLEDLDFLIT
jgi:transcription elongation factor GreA-like protein